MKQIQENLKQPSKAADRRDSGRVACEAVHCSVGEVLDLSATGMCLKRSRTRMLTFRKVFTAEFRIGDRVVRISCRVIWMRQVGLLHQVLGVRFVEPTTDTQIQLLQLAKRSCVVA